VVGERNVVGTGLGAVGVRARVAAVQGAQGVQGAGKRRPGEVGGPFLFGV